MVRGHSQWFIPKFSRNFYLAKLSPATVSPHKGYISEGKIIIKFKLLLQFTKTHRFPFNWFKNVLLELFSLQLSLFFFPKMMKFYKDTCSGWHHMRRKTTIGISSIYWNVPLWIFQTDFKAKQSFFRQQCEQKSWRNNIVIGQLPPRKTVPSP